MCVYMCVYVFIKVCMFCFSWHVKWPPIILSALSVFLNQFNGDHQIAPFCQVLCVF